MALVVFGLHDIRAELAKPGFPFIFDAVPFDYATAIIYNCFQRVAWSLSLCWIIFACSKGYGGIVNDILSWGVFAPLSRLTFFMYLIHIDLESIFFYSMDYTFTFTDLQFSIWFIGLMMMIGGLAFVATLSFEIPFAKLEAMLIGAIMRAPTKKTQVTSARNTHDLNLTKKEKEEPSFPGKDAKEKSNEVVD